MLKSGRRLGDQIEQVLAKNSGSILKAVIVDEVKGNDNHYYLVLESQETEVESIVVRMKRIENEEIYVTDLMKKLNDYKKEVKK